MNLKAPLTPLTTILKKQRKRMEYPSARSFPADAVSMLRATIITVLILLLPVMARTAPAPAAGLTKAEIMRLGERMYREGILPSGKAMETSQRGTAETGSTAFSCSSCHLRAGLGSVEGVVVTPPATGSMLYKPAFRPQSPDNAADRSGRNVYSATVVKRPAYTRTSLAHALRNGVDSGGRRLNDVMPRYQLNEHDMEILISYLEMLSSTPSPGASSDMFNFATIVTDDVSQDDRMALLLPLQDFIDQQNQQRRLYADFINFGFDPTIDLKHAFHKATLDVWELKGPPESWPGQLEAYYSTKPVFAVLGGISNKDWSPIHTFCETKRLPCLFPVTDFPKVSDAGWYTYYFSKGYIQEGEAVARFLNQREPLTIPAPILQIVQDSPAGRALADGFLQTWKELERPAAITLTLTAHQLRDTATLTRLVKTHNPRVLILWADGTVLPNLPALTPLLSAPGMVFLSSGFLGDTAAALPEAVRDRAYLTYPYRLTPFFGTRDGGYDARIPILASPKDIGSRRISSRTTTIMKQLMPRALNLLYDNLYRDHLLDIITMQMDLTVPDYERLSFGVGQRYASKGCYIIQLGAGDTPALLPRSEWIIH